MNKSVSAQSGVKSMSDVYSTDLMRDITTVIFNEYEMADPEIIDRCEQVHRHITSVSDKFPFRRIQLLRILFRSTTVDEIDERVLAEDEFYSKRELDLAAAAEPVREEGW